nr:MAG TPA: hypothetical protein [Caudoviricetes sp.]
MRSCFTSILKLKKQPIIYRLLVNWFIFCF